MKFFLQALLLTSVSVSIATANDADLVDGDAPSTPRNQPIQVTTPTAPKKYVTHEELSPTRRSNFDDSDSDSEF